MIKDNKITILESIAVDFKLPKHIKPKKPTNGFDGSSKFEGSITVDDGDFSIPTASWNVNDNDGNRTHDIDYIRYIYDNRPSWINGLRYWIYKKLYSKQLNINKKKRIKSHDLSGFFDSIKSGLDELTKNSISEIIQKYDTVLDNAKYNNQIALIERIEDYAKVLKYEIILSTTTFNKYLTEDDVVKFYNLASNHEKFNTGLRLTYIKNFIKIIPENITLLKKEADSLRVFDNYVILHYDYDGKSIADTKEEIEKKKDPILFGVIKNSHKLYYIGDWIDDYCDLTLDVIIKKIGKAADTLDGETIIKEIEKI